MTELVKIALAEYGTREFFGAEINPKVIHYFHDIGYRSIIDENVAWCSAFINWIAIKGGYEHSGKLTARSWLEQGEEVTDPQLGDLAIFWREHPNSWKGHVGLFVNCLQDDKSIHCLGGNQNNSVSIKAYSKKRLLGFRRLRKNTNQQTELI